MQNKQFVLPIQVAKRQHPDTSSNIWEGATSSGIHWAVYQGDAKSVLSKLPTDTFDCVVTSPPYYWLRDYGVEDQIGLENTVSEYVTAISSVMDEVQRVLKPSGVMFLNIGDTYYSGKGESKGQDRKSRKRRFGLRAVDKSGGLGIGLQPKTLIGVPWRVAVEMSSRKWVLRSAIIWHRAGRLNEAVKDRPRRSYEYIFMFTKNRRYYFNRSALIDQHIEEDMWTITARPRPTPGIDTAPFPDELVRRCLDVGCPPEGVVLDPFAGSGTTMRVALQTNRAATGIELSADFCEYIVESIHGV